MHGYLIDVENDEHRVVDIKDGNRLEQYHDLIGCECIDIVVRSIGGNPYNIVLDDEGLLVSDPIVSAYDKSHRPMLVGNLIIFGMDEQCDLNELTVSDIARIKENILYTIDLHRGAMHPVVIMSY